MSNPCKRVKMMQIKFDMKINSAQAIRKETIANQCFVWLLDHIIKI